MKELSEFDSIAFKKRADAYWEPPMCRCDWQSSPDGKPGWMCDECGKEIPVAVADDRESQEY